MRGADLGERILVLERADVRDEEREPERLLDVVERRDVGVQARRVGGELGEARGRERELGGEPLGVGGRLDARDELGAIAVVGGLRELAHAHGAAAPGPRAPRGAGATR